MGIKFILNHRNAQKLSVPLSYFRNQIVAIDISVELHRYIKLSSNCKSYRELESILPSQIPIVERYLWVIRNIIDRIIFLARLSIIPLVCFDNRNNPNPLKMQEIELRATNRQHQRQFNDHAIHNFQQLLQPTQSSYSNMSHRDYDQTLSPSGVLQQLLIYTFILFQIPYIISPLESDGQCIQLCTNNVCSAVITTDSDLLLHGITTIEPSFNLQSTKFDIYIGSSIAKSFVDETLFDYANNSGRQVRKSKKYKYDPYHQSYQETTLPLPIPPNTLQPTLSISSTSTTHSTLSTTSTSIPSSPFTHHTISHHKDQSKSPFDSLLTTIQSHRPHHLTIDHLIQLQQLFHKQLLQFGLAQLRRIKKIVGLLQQFDLIKFLRYKKLNQSIVELSELNQSNFSDTTTNDNNHNFHFHETLTTPTSSFQSCAHNNNSISTHHHNSGILSKSLLSPLSTSIHNHNITSNQQHIPYLPNRAYYKNPPTIPQTSLSTRFTVSSHSIILQLLAILTGCDYTQFKLKTYPSIKIITEVLGCGVPEEAYYAVQNLDQISRVRCFERFLVDNLHSLLIIRRFIFQLLLQFDLNNQHKLRNITTQQVTLTNSFNNQNTTPQTTYDENLQSFDSRITMFSTPAKSNRKQQQQYSQQNQSQQPQLNSFNSSILIDCKSSNTDSIRESTQVSSQLADTTPTTKTTTTKTAKRTVQEDHFTQSFQLPPMYILPTLSQLSHNFHETTTPIIPYDIINQKYQNNSNMNSNFPNPQHQSPLQSPPYIHSQNPYYDNPNNTSNLPPQSPITNTSSLNINNFQAMSTPQPIDEMNSEYHSPHHDQQHNFEPQQQSIQQDSLLTSNSLLHIHTGPSYYPDPLILYQIAYHVALKMELDPDVQSTLTPTTTTTKSTTTTNTPTPQSDPNHNESTSTTTTTTNNNTYLKGSCHNPNIEFPSLEHFTLIYQSLLMFNHHPSYDINHIAPRTDHTIPLSNIHMDFLSGAHHPMVASNLIPILDPIPPILSLSYNARLKSIQLQQEQYRLNELAKLKSKASYYQQQFQISNNNNHNLCRCLPICNPFIKSTILHFQSMHLNHLAHFQVAQLKHIGDVIDVGYPSLSLERSPSTSQTPNQQQEFVSPQSDLQSTIPNAKIATITTTSLPNSVQNRHSNHHPLSSPPQLPTIPPSLIPQQHQVHHTPQQDQLQQPPQQQQTLVRKQKPQPIPPAAIIQALTSKVQSNQCTLEAIPNITIRNCFHEFSQYEIDQLTTIHYNNVTYLPTPPIQIYPNGIDTINQTQLSTTMTNRTTTPTTTSTTTTTTTKSTTQTNTNVISGYLYQPNDEAFALGGDLLLSSTPIYFHHKTNTYLQLPHYLEISLQTLLFLYPFLKPNEIESLSNNDPNNNSIPNPFLSNSSNSSIQINSQSHLINDELLSTELPKSLHHTFTSFPKQIKLYTNDLDTLSMLITSLSILTEILFPSPVEISPNNNQHHHNNSYSNLTSTKNHNNSTIDPIFDESSRSNPNHYTEVTIPLQIDKYTFDFMRTNPKPIQFSESNSNDITFPEWFQTISIPTNIPLEQQHSPTKTTPSKQQHHQRHYQSPSSIASPQTLHTIQNNNNKNRFGSSIHFPDWLDPLFNFDQKIISQDFNHNHNNNQYNSHAKLITTLSHNIYNSSISMIYNIDGKFNIIPKEPYRSPFLGLGATAHLNFGKFFFFAKPVNNCFYYQLISGVLGPIIVPNDSLPPTFNTIVNTQKAAIYTKFKSQIQVQSQQLMNVSNDIDNIQNDLLTQEDIDMVNNFDGSSLYELKRWLEWTSDFEQSELDTIFRNCRWDWSNLFTINSLPHTCCGFQLQDAIKQVLSTFPNIQQQQLLDEEQEDIPQVYGQHGEKDQLKQHINTMHEDHNTLNDSNELNIITPPNSASIDSDLLLTPTTTQPASALFAPQSNQTKVSSPSITTSTMTDIDTFSIQSQELQSSSLNSQQLPQSSQHSQLQHRTTKNQPKSQLEFTPSKPTIPSRPQSQIPHQQQSQQRQSQQHQSQQIKSQQIQSQQQKSKQLSSQQESIPIAPNVKPMPSTKRKSIPIVLDCSNDDDDDDDDDDLFDPPPPTNKLTSNKVISTPHKSTIKSTPIKSTPNKSTVTSTPIKIKSKTITTDLTTSSTKKSIDLTSTDLAYQSTNTKKSRSNVTTPTKSITLDKQVQLSNSTPISITNSKFTTPSKLTNHTPSKFTPSRYSGQSTPSVLKPKQIQQSSSDDDDDELLFDDD